MTSPRTRLAALALALLLGGACSFLKAHSDQTRYFVLTSSAPKQPAAPVSVVVGLDRVELPEYVLRSELVTRSASNQLQIAEYEVWGEPLKDGFARTLRRDLENELGGARVLAAPFDPAARPDLAVDVDVQRFERDVGAGAVLDARWTLRDVKNGTVVARRDVRERQPLADTSAQSSVGALSRDVAALAAEIAAAVRVTAAGRSP
jgi:uncharacterized lipoprotein YmbA